MLGMYKTLLSLFLLSVLLLASSCKKTLELANDDKVSFIVRLPSSTIAHFEIRCVSEDIFLEQVKIQSPSGGFVTEVFDNQRIAINEIFLVGNQLAADGTWLITILGNSAITNANFNIIVPYEMVLIGDDNE